MGGIGATITLAIEPSFAGVRRFRVIGIIWNTAGALADVIIAAALVWHLVRSSEGVGTPTFALTLFRSALKRDHKTGMTVTDNLINKIIRSEWQTSIAPVFRSLTVLPST